MGLAAITLLHVLVFVYWLGGDLGAFYTSFIVADGKRPPAARIAAAQALSNIDMAPRTALILTLPTGVTLARAAGWIGEPAWAVPAVWVFGLAWLGLAWRVHLAHLPPSNPWRRLDLVIRWAVLAALAVAGVGILTGHLAAPRFIGLKLLILAGAIAVGLWVRALLVPFGQAFGALVTTGATEEGDAVIARTLARVRPTILLIWLLLLAAAFLGLWRPA